MKALWLWMRRGVGLVLPPVILSFLGVTAAANRGWALDADWGIRYTAGAVILLAPLVAAMVAYDTARRLAPGLAGVARTSTRGMRAVLLPMLAVVAWAVLSTAIAWLAIAVVATRLGGVPPQDPWVWVEMPAAYLAAGAIGLLVGSRTPTVVAVALSAGGVFVLASLLGGQGIKALQLAMSTGTMIGLERTPSRALLSIAVNVGIALGAVAAALLLNGPRRPQRALLAATALPAVLAVALHVGYPFQDSEYRPSRTPAACWGSSPTLCGPASAAALLGDAQRDLASARTHLQPSGLPLPDAFTAARPDRFTTLGTAAPLEYDPSALVDGHLPRDTVVQAMATPRLCAALLSEDSAPQYLALSATTADWIRASLASDEVTAAPPAVRAAYATLSACAVAEPERR